MGEPRDLRVLGRMLERLVHPVRLLVYRDPAHPDPRLDVAVAALIAAAPRLLTARFEESDGPTRMLGHIRLEPPGVVVPGQDPGDAPFVFQGVPAGYQFATLLTAVMDRSTRQCGLTPDHARQLASVQCPVLITVYVLSTCPFSPRTARLAAMAGTANRRIQALVVDAAALVERSPAAEVRAVPQMVIARPGRHLSVVLDGIPREGDMVEAILDLTTSA